MKPLRLLFFLFIAIPLFEVWLLVKVGGLIGAWPTVGLVLFTAVAGAALLRREGLSTLLRGTQRMDAGELPAQEMLEGLVLAVSGALLLTPGFATDVIGFAGLMPWFRRWAIQKLLAQGQVFHVSSAHARHFHRQSGDDSRTIDGDFWREDKK